MDKVQKLNSNEEHEFWMTLKIGDIAGLRK
jgi:hypothetical protein